MKDEITLLQTAFDLLPFDLYVVDLETLEIIFINRQLRAAPGGRQNAPCWERLYQLEGPCPHCRVPALLEKYPEAPLHAEIHELYHEARETWFHLTERAMRWPDGRLVKYSFAVDISQLKSAQNSLVEAHARLALHAREIREISITDHLTGAYTRRHLDQVMATEISRATRGEHALAVVLCDIDRFKSVNDRLGHAAGDRLLIEMVRLFKGSIRKMDTLGRWGGEEFLVVLPEIDLAGAIATAEKLRGTIAAADFGEIGPCSASFGVAIMRPNETAEQLVERADRGLYAAKAGGRDRVEIGPGDVSDLANVMAVIERRTLAFATEELGMTARQPGQRLYDPGKTPLRDLTVVIAIGPRPDLRIVYSFAAGLIAEIARRLTADLRATAADRPGYVQESACEMVNIVVGNSTAELAGKGEILQMSPPRILEDGTQIPRAGELLFAVDKLEFEAGGLDIALLGPAS